MIKSKADRHLDVMCFPTLSPSGQFGEHGPVPLVIKPCGHKDRANCWLCAGKAVIQHAANQ